MELRYRFEPERFRLGKLCKYGHRWPGTDQSLRRIHPTTPSCVGCNGARKRNWLINFIDYEALGFPAGFRLGKPCKAGHQWHQYELTLRNSSGHCVECEKLRVRRQPTKVRRKQYFDAMIERIGREEYLRREIERHKGQWQRLTSEQRMKRAQYKRELRKKQSGCRVSAEERLMQRAICSAGKLPNVIRLVAAEQRRYWDEHPKEYKEHCRKSKRDRARWRQLTDPEFRLYHRQKSKRRKALLKNTIGLQLKGKQVNARFAQFSHQCAYCGASGDLHIEHVVPISKGGTHALGNIVPACQRCNFSKAANEVETWYFSQPFFCEQRWKKLRRVIGWAKSSTGQLALL